MGHKTLGCNTDTADAWDLTQQALPGILVFEGSRGVQDHLVLCHAHSRIVDMTVVRSFVRESKNEIGRASCRERV